MEHTRKLCSDFKAFEVECWKGSTSFSIQTWCKIPDKEIVIYIGSPLPLPPLQDQNNVDPVSISAQEWSEASVKESLDAVPETMLYSPTSSDGVGGGKSGTENQFSTDVSRTMGTNSSSGPSVGQVFQLVLKVNVINATIVILTICWCVFPQ